MTLFLMIRPREQYIRQARIESPTAPGIKLRKEHYNFSNSGLMQAQGA